MLSIVVCTYNRAASLRETLATLTHQTFEGGSVEIIVVDNNSTDETPQTVEEMARDSAWPMRYMLEARQGLSHARNRGIEEAQGELIAFTDDDVLVETGWAKALWEASTRYEAAVVGGPVLPRWSCAPPAWFFNERVNRRLHGVFAWLDRGAHPQVATAEEIYFLFGANMAFQRHIFRELGGFSSELGRKGKGLLGGEESEMLQRVLRAGKRVVYIPGARVSHKIPPERMSLQYIRQWKFHSGRSEVLRSEKPVRAVPGWLIRECTTHAWHAVIQGCRRDCEGWIQHEMLFWFQLGQLVEMMRVRVGRHAGQRHANSQHHLANL